MLTWSTASSFLCFLKKSMTGVGKVFLVLYITAWAHCAPHHHHHHLYKTVYVGGDGGGHADVGAAGSGGLSFSASLGGNGGVHKELRHEVISEKVIDVEVPPAPEVKAQKTVIERTVIPQYVEKTVRVPTYVEKTIRVPSYVEKRVKVPVESAVVEKTISHEHVPVDEVKLDAHAAKTLAVQKEISFAGERNGRGHADGAVYVGGGGHGQGFFDRIFNIPIQTLGAVNGLLNGLGGGGGGGHVSAGFSKSYSAY